MNLVRLQYGGGGGELRGAIIYVTTTETSLIGKKAYLYKDGDTTPISNATISSSGSCSFTVLEVGTYTVKASDSTYEAEGSVSIDSEQIINKDIVSVELSFVVTITFDVYSAPNDSIYYYEDDNISNPEITLCTTNADGKGTGSLIVNKYNAKNITFYSTVAKDTTDGTSAYSKSISIDSSTSEIYVMPEGAVYWYGNMCTELPLGGGEYMNTENGWSSITFINPVPNTNYLDCNGTSASLIYSGIGTKNIIDISKYSICKVIAKGIKAQNSNYGSIFGLTSKTPNIDGARTVSVALNSSDITKISVNLPASTKYASYHSGNGRRSNLYAMWLE